ncbi:hypothetical protein ACFLY2_00835 [Patescibacteria group bacterium]
MVPSSGQHNQFTVVIIGLVLKYIFVVSLELTTVQEMIQVDLTSIVIFK